MKSNENQTMFCKKIVYSRPGNDQPNIILGVIVFEDQFFLKIKTKNKIHLVSKQYLISVSDTFIRFEGELAIEPGEDEIKRNETNPGSSHLFGGAE